jgi:hypothetical protein
LADTLRRSSHLSRFFRYLLDVRGDAQVLPFSVGFHLREIIPFREKTGRAFSQTPSRLKFFGRPILQHWLMNRSVQNIS